MSDVPQAPFLSLVQQANTVLAQGDKAKALTLYQQAAYEQPYLAEHLAFLVAYLQAELTGGALSSQWQTYTPVALPSVLITAQPESPTKGTLHENRGQKNTDNNYLPVTVDSLSFLVFSLPQNVSTLDDGQWQALNADPHFIAPLQHAPLAAGFYAFTVEISTAAATQPLHTKLYIDYGNGFSEQNRVLFSVKANKAASRVVHFKQPVMRLRFDPAEQVITFGVASLSLQYLEETAALVSMAAFAAEHYAEPPAQDDNYAQGLYSQYDEWVCKDASKLTYDEWIAHKETARQLTAAQFNKALAALSFKPTLSMVVAVTENAFSSLSATIASVLTQSYTLFECLVVCDDAISPADMALLFAEFETDERVKQIRLSGYANKAQLLNRALAQAKGEFFALVSANDCLAEHALFYMAHTINNFPQGQIFYSDEDRLDEEGKRVNPHFKTAWNPDLFFATNYVANLALFRTSLIKLVGGYHAEKAEAVSYDLLLRCLPYVNPNEIHHVARILYHARMTPSLNEQVQHLAAGKKALQDYFAANGPEGVTVDTGLVAQSYKVNWPIPNPAPKVSLVMPTRDLRAVTEVAVRSILTKTHYANYEIIIVDNGSIESETLAFFQQIQQEDSRVSVIRYDQPFNYSAINNVGVAHCNGELLGLINNDIEVINAEWLTEMVSHAIRPDIGCVGAKLYYPNGRIQHAGVILGIGGVASHGFKLFPEQDEGYAQRLKLVQNYSAVTAACLLVRRDVYEAVGGLNAADLAVGYNDIDFCLKVRRKGLRNVWSPYAQLIHYESISRGDDISPEKQDRLKNEREYMLANWGAVLANDPYYSPHLTLDADDFSLRVHSSSPLSFDNSILYSWDAADRARHHKYACVFVGFDAKSVLHEYVVYYLRALAKYFDIYFISTAEQLHESAEQLKVLQGICKSIVVRENQGYDFGSWAYGVNHYRAELTQYAGVLLNNDSVYGPLFDLGDFITAFEQPETDVLGLTDSNELDYHLQSYFVMYKAAVFNSALFRTMWQQISVHTDKWDIIKKYEIGFSQRLLRVGKLRLRAYCDMTGYPNLNHTHVHWQDLITKKRFPFVKIELVKKNPFNINTLELENVIKACSDYDISLIKKH